jgi:hypothetical protein
MVTDVDEVFTRGGRGLIDLLEYCVVSVRCDPIFVFLVREYRLQPSAPRAIALHEMFCERDAPARLSIFNAVAPGQLALRQRIEPLRAAWLALEARAENGGGAAHGEPADEETEASAVPVPVPAKYLFDKILRAVARGGQLMQVARDYDPALEPVANLPGGCINAGQRAFVENVWQPRMRPCLVSAGFRRIANVG